MTTWLLFFFVFLEVLLGTLAGRWLSPAFASWPWALQIPAGWLLLGPLARFLVIGGSFALSYVHRSRAIFDKDLSFRAYLCFCVWEFGGFLYVFSFLQPFAWLVTRPRSPQPQAPSPAHRPLLLLHGFFCNSGFFRKMEKRFAKAGYTDIYTMDLPLFGDLDDFATLLTARVEAICQGTGADKVFVIAHSMGGLVTRAALLQEGLRVQVAGLITLGTPHHGTVLADAPWAFGTNVRQMRYKSPWLRALQEAEAHLADLPPLVCLYCPQDQIVAPQDSAILPRASHIAPLVGIGHTGLAVSSSAFEVILQNLRRLEDTAAA